MVIIGLGSIVLIAIAPTVIGYGIAIILWNIYDLICEKYLPKKKSEVIEMGVYENVYYTLFPKELEKKEKQIKDAELVEKAGLLLEFEEIAKKKEELEKYLKEQTEFMEEFREAINEVTRADPFGRGYNMRFARWRMHRIELYKLETYKKLKEKALEYERLTFRMFAINQKLRLLEQGHRLRKGYEYV